MAEACTHSRITLGDRSIDVDRECYRWEAICLICGERFWAYDGKDKGNWNKDPHDAVWNAATPREAGREEERQ